MIPNNSSLFFPLMILIGKQSCSFYFGGLIWSILPIKNLKYGVTRG